MVAVVTGSRSEFGLLVPVIRAIAAHPMLRLRLIVTGTHLLPQEQTINDVRAAFSIDAAVQMYDPAKATRADHAEALGMGLAGLAREFAANAPSIVLVLGDRIEAFAAAAAAAVAGVHVAHLHGGDRAEGIADESMRHAISKLAHIHLPATSVSSHRLVAMGEDPARVHVVGSPAIDGLADALPMSDAEYDALGSPRILVLLHPVGDSDAIEGDRAARLLSMATRHGHTLAMNPNHDPGRNGIIQAISASGGRAVSHVPRDRFISLIKRVDLIVGNSSAGLIECAAVGLRCVNIGPRQAGRESPPTVTAVPWNDAAIDKAILENLAAARLSPQVIAAHPYGDGRTGPRTADLLATLDFTAHALTKRNTY